MKKPPIRLVGFSKKKKLEVTLLLYDHDERKTVKDAYYFFDPDTLIQCRECKISSNVCPECGYSDYHYTCGRMLCLKCKHSAALVDVLIDELKLKDLFNAPKK